MPTFGPVAFLPHDVNYVQKYVQQILNLLYLNGRWTWYNHSISCSAALRCSFLLRVLKLSRPAALVAATDVPCSVRMPMGSALRRAWGRSSWRSAISLSCFPSYPSPFERRTVLMFGLLSAAIGTLLLTNHMPDCVLRIHHHRFVSLYTVIMDFPAAKLCRSAKDSPASSAPCSSGCVFPPTFTFPSMSTPSFRCAAAGRRDRAADWRTTMPRTGSWSPWGGDRSPDSRILTESPVRRARTIGDSSSPGRMRTSNVGLVRSSS